MKTPGSLEPLLRRGLIDEVVRPLTSGKEAAVYLVRTPEGMACAKVYKDAIHRSFRNRAQYMEGHQVKPGRRQGRRNRKRQGRWD